MVERQGRQLAAVMFCDMVGFTAAMQEDEQAALTSRDRYRTVIEHLHDEFGGQIVQYYGDGTLSVFGNTVDAVRCAVAIQQTLSEAPAVPVRVGLHVGDVVVEEHGLLGDAVNVASRIESFGMPGAVLLSDSVHDLVKNQPDMEFVSLGEFHLDNVARPHEMFAVDTDGLIVPDAASLVGKGRRVGTAVLSNLPVQVTSFVGRVQESAELEKLIRGSRLVTVTGAGGCGKSRLVVEVAAEQLDEYPDGVWLVELAPLSDGRLVASTVANVLGVREQPGVDTLDVLTGFFGEKHLLMVVDNCEHLIEPIADLVAHLLGHTTDVRIVATSREPLHVRGEAVYHLPTLPVPGPDDDWETLTRIDSVRLFAERAEPALPGFRVTHDNGSAVASLCRRLDGIPLAVELAAATTRMFTPQQIEQRLSDRFQLLTGGARDDVDHHRTLKATIDWSYRLLPPEQQVMFARLAVFAGPFTLDAVEAVCADDSIPPASMFGHIAQLADRSLLETEQGGSGVRYRMLETIRSYATGMLRSLPQAAREALNQRHCEYFLSLAEEVTEGPISADIPPPWIANLDASTPDLRQALGWAIDGDHDQYAVDLAGALGFYWWFRKRIVDAVHWFLLVPLDSKELTPESRIRALRHAAMFLSRGRVDGAGADRGWKLAEEGLRLAREFGDPELIAFELLDMGMIVPDLDDAFSYLSEGRSLAETCGSEYLTAWIRHIIALRHREAGSIDEAKNLFEVNLGVADRTGDDRLAAWTLGFLGSIACTRDGDFNQAVQFLEDAVARSRGVDDQGALVNALLFLGQATYYLGDLRESREHFTECDDVNRRLYGTDDEYAWSWLGLIAYDEHDQQEARWRLKVALKGYRSLESPNTWDTHMLRRTLWTLALVTAEEDLLEQSAILLGASESAAHEPARRLADGTLYPPWFEVGGEQANHERLCNDLGLAMSIGAFNQARQQGAAMTLDEAVDYALNLLDDA